jgi:excisionase family DNA binding protein
MMPELLTIREVAKLLGLHVNTIRKLMEEGELKYFRVGEKSIRFKLETIMEYIEKKSRR